MCKEKRLWAVRPRTADTAPLKHIRYLEKLSYQIQSSSLKGSKMSDQKSGSNMKYAHGYYSCHGTDRERC